MSASPGAPARKCAGSASQQPKGQQQLWIMQHLSDVNASLCLPHLSDLTVPLCLLPQVNVQENVQGLRVTIHRTACYILSDPIVTVSLLRR